MEDVGVAHCKSCRAVVNVHWPACAACQRPLPARPDLEPGCLLWWQGMDGTTHGPALLRGTFESQGWTWAWFTQRGVEYLVWADLVTKVQQPFTNLAS